MVRPARERSFDSICFPLLGCLLVSPNAQEVFQAFVSRRKSFTNGHGSTSPIPRVQISDLSEEELKSSVERLLFTNHSPMDLRILVCLMCGGEKNEVEHFIEQLSTRFTLVETTRSSFMITASLGRSTRRVSQSNERMTRIPSD